MPISLHLRSDNNAFLTFSFLCNTYTIMLKIPAQCALFDMRFVNKFSAHRLNIVSITGTILTFLLSRSYTEFDHGYPLILFCWQLFDTIGLLIYKIIECLLFRYLFCFKIMINNRHVLIRSCFDGQLIKRYCRNFHFQY